MKKETVARGIRLLRSVLVLVATIESVALLSAQQTAITKTALQVGQRAPDFALLSDKWETVKLRDFRGKENVVLVFYVLAFSQN